MDERLFVFVKFVNLQKGGMGAFKLKVEASRDLNRRML